MMLRALLVVGIFVIFSLASLPQTREPQLVFVPEKWHDRASATANFLDFLKNVEDGNVFSDWKFDVKLKSVSTESYVRVNWDTPTSQLQNRNLKLRHRHFLSGADTGLRDLTWKIFNLDGVVAAAYDMNVAKAYSDYNEQKIEEDLFWSTSTCGFHHSSKVTTTKGSILPKNLTVNTLNDIAKYFPTLPAIAGLPTSTPLGVSFVSYCYDVVIPIAFGDYITTAILETQYSSLDLMIAGNTVPDRAELSWRVKQDADGNWPVANMIQSEQFAKYVLANLPGVVAHKAPHH